MGIFSKKKASEKPEPKAAGPDPLLRLLELTQAIHSTLEVDKALEIILDGALELTKMQRGFIMLLTDDGELEFKMGRNHRHETLANGDFEVSSTLTKKSVEQRELVFFSNLKDKPTTSAMKLQIVCGLCVPLFASYSTTGAGSARRVIGVLYADSKTGVRFRTEEREIANSLGLHAGLALENATLFELAVRDGLTRLYQKRYFDSLSEVEWKRTVRYKRSLSALMLDLDYFKKINDTEGHDAGDRILKKTAMVLKTCCRAEDILARYGGDEFIALLPETDRTGAEQVARRILVAIPEAIESSKKAFTASIGVASYPESSAGSVEALIKLADVSLYEAKKKRNTVVVHPPSPRHR